MKSANAVGEDAKVRVKEYLGFLNWWSSSVTYWDAPLEQWMVDYVNAFQLHSLRKRGVLVDVTQRYRTLNVRHLLAKDVPLYYFWMAEMSSYPGFTRLSPMVLQAYHDTCESLDKAWVFGAEMVGFQNELELIRDYDEFFQRRQDPYSMSLPAFTDIPPSSKVYICNFKGWKARLLTDTDVIADYLRQYHFTIDEGMLGSPVTIWCGDLRLRTQVAAREPARKAQASPERPGVGTGKSVRYSRVCIVLLQGSTLTN